MTKKRAPWLFAASVVLLAGVFWLGAYVTHHGEPPALMAFALSVRGHALSAAWAFTNAGYAYVLAPLYAACIIVAVVSPRWRLVALLVVASGLIAWGAADGLQHYFARPRRHDWLIKRELAFSYPSSHAAISTAFYFFAGVLALRSKLPRALAVAAFAVLTVLTAGICWSRLALAAHYPTDVIGGIALGLVIICALMAAVRTA